MSAKKRWTYDDLGRALAAWGDEGEYHEPAKGDRDPSHVVILSKGGTVFKLFLCQMVNPITGSSAARRPKRETKASTRSG